MKIHFIGIGGIGVSALAKYYLEKGHKISGSDLVSSEITDALKKTGAKIFIGRHQEKNIPAGTDLVIYSPAVQKNNSELMEAKRLGIKTQSYPEALGELTKKHFTIAVSGTHGKSTTTAMIGILLTKAGLDPTVIVGTKLKEFSAQGGLASGEGTNFRAGKSKYLVIEADEWNASFLNYWPKIIVLTNIEKEHLDYYKDLNHILRTFKEYIGHLPKEGILVANREDENISKIKEQKSKLPTVRTQQFKVQNYSLKQKEAKIIKKILKIPGEHNVSNALAALTVARILKIPDKISFKALSEYQGAWRRFEIKRGRVGSKNFTIINDYGHHPTEILVTLKAAREKFLYPPKFSSPTQILQGKTWVGKKRKLRRASKKIWCIFQPHQYQRTYYLFADFVKNLRKCQDDFVDKLIIADIYDVAGRENREIKQKINSQKLVWAINRSKTVYVPKKEIKNYLKTNIKGGEIVVIMGAGDIYKLSNQF